MEELNCLVRKIAGHRDGEEYGGHMGSQGRTRIATVARKERHYVAYTASGEAIYGLQSDPL